MLDQYLMSSRHRPDVGWKIQTQQRIFLQGKVIKSLFIKLQHYFCHLTLSSVFHLLRGSGHTENINKAHVHIYRLLSSHTVQVTS